MHHQIVKFDLAKHTQRCNINRYIYNNEKYLHYILVVSNLCARTKALLNMLDTLESDNRHVNSTISAIRMQIVFVASVCFAFSYSPGIADL